MLFIEYPKCTTCQKAKKWLDAHGAVYTDRPIKEENPTAAYAVPPAAVLTLDLNGHRAVGRIVNKGTLIIDLNGGSFNYVTGAEAASTAYQAIST